LHRHYDSMAFRRQQMLPQHCMARIGHAPL
jgi:hypothetical protein